jgi:hypothetical protein
MQQPTTRHAGYVSASYTVVDGTLAIATEPAPAMRAKIARFGTHYQVRPLRNGNAGRSPTRSTKRSPSLPSAGGCCAAASRGKRP